MNHGKLSELCARYEQSVGTSLDEVRVRRVTRVQTLLMGSRRESLAEPLMRALLIDTDAYERWGNADALFDRRVREVGLEGLRSAIDELATRAQLGLTRSDLETLWARRGLGLLVSTELLCYLAPDRHWVLDPARTFSSLKTLGEDVKSALARGHRKDPDLYLALAPRMAVVRDALEQTRTLARGQQAATDFLDASWFLSWVAQEEPEISLRVRRSEPSEEVRTYASAPPRGAISYVAEGPHADEDKSHGQLPLVAPASGEQARTTLERALQEQGLYYPPHRLASFYTALQVKGFLVLSGISGTGKTRLAQAFAELLPQPHVPRRGATVPHDAVVVTVQPYMLATGRLLVPRQAARLFDPPVADEARDVTVVFDGHSESCPFVRASYAGRDYLSLSLRKSARAWLAGCVSPGDSVVLEPVLGHDDVLDAFRISLATEWAASSPDERPRNWIFVPVRPDWRDSRALLGYFNPITRSYEWTAFLRFLVRAARGYRNNDGLARFVILDEMNLAHVEHYLSDLLSVLESGRDEHGWTREALVFSQPDDAEGDLPPRELKLPPSLYFIGTVNADETTHAFSPKVLDRAFVLDFGDADLRGYPPSPVAPMPSVPGESLALLRSFARGGRFAHVDKHALHAYVREQDTLRARLATLHAALRPYDLHFGYRVYDELAAFVEISLQNGWYSDPVASLDAAVSMKILPRFHGARRKLDAPLRALLAVCVDPDQPREGEIRSALAEIPDDPGEALAATRFALEHTAAAAIRLLRKLYADGFAAFGA